MSNKIAMKVELKGGNGLVSPGIKLADSAEDAATVRLFRIMYNRFSHEKSPVIFDPLKLFEIV